MLDLLRYRVVVALRKLAGSVWWGAWRDGYDRGWDDCWNREVGGPDGAWERGYAEGFTAGRKLGRYEARGLAPHERGYDD